jgi:hypothetical protein
MTRAALFTRASNRRPFERLVMHTKRFRRHKFVHTDVIEYRKNKEEERQEYKGTKYYNL